MSYKEGEHFKRFLYQQFTECPSLTHTSHRPEAGDRPETNLIYSPIASNPVHHISHRRGTSNPFCGRVCLLFGLFLDHSVQITEEEGVIWCLCQLQTFRLFLFLILCGTASDVFEKSLAWVWGVRKALSWVTKTTNWDDIRGQNTLIKTLRCVNKRVCFSASMCVCARHACVCVSIHARHLFFVCK